MEIIGVILTNAGRVALTIREVRGIWYGYSPEIERTLILEADRRGMEIGELIDEMNRGLEDCEHPKDRPALTWTLTATHKKSLPDGSFMQAFRAKGNAIMQEIDNAIKRNELWDG